MTTSLKYKNKTPRPWKIAVTSAIAIAASACVTGTDKTTAAKDIFATTTGNIVVQRIGSKEPIVSPFGKNHWMDARNSKDANIVRIQALLATGEPLAAETDARKYLAVHPGNLEGLTALASALAQSGQYDLAAYYAKLVAAKLPDNPHSTNILALSILMGATKIDEFRRAEALFEKAFNESPVEVAAGLNLGHLYLELGNSSLALRVFDTVSERCGECGPALMGVGIASRRLGRDQEALDAFNKLVSANKADVEALYHIALVYRDGVKDRKKAEEALRKLIAVDSKNSVIKERAHTILRSMLSETTPKNGAPGKSSNDTADESDIMNLDEVAGEVSPAPKLQAKEPATQPASAPDSDFATVSSTKEDTNLSTPAEDEKATALPVADDKEGDAALF